MTHVIVPTVPMTRGTTCRVERIRPLAWFTAVFVFTRGFFDRILHPSDS